MKIDYNPLIVNLVKKITKLKNSKEKINNRYEFFTNKFNENGINKKEFNAIKSVLLRDKPIDYWNNYYDSEINKLKKKKKKYEKKQRFEKIKKICLIIFPVIIILFSMFIMFKPEITGRSILENKTITNKVNLYFNDSFQYKLNLSSNITSLRVSGNIIGDGSVKIYLNEKLILDSSRLKNSGGLYSITGHTVNNKSINNINETKNNGSLIKNNSGLFNESINFTSETNSSYNESNSSDNLSQNKKINLAANNILNISGNISGNISVNKTDNATENTSIKINQSIINSSVNSPADNNSIINTTINQTKKILFNSTKENKTDNQILMEFESYCLETCFLDNINENITLNIEIVDAELNLSEIIYTFSETKKEENENRSLLNQSTKNDTVKKQDIESLNISEQNTSINHTKPNITYQKKNHSDFKSTQIKVNEPVLWTKKINASEINEIELIKYAYNVSVDKNQENVKILSDNNQLSLSEFNLYYEYEQLNKKFNNLQKPTKKHDISKKLNRISSLNKRIIEISKRLDNIKKNNYTNNFILKLDNFKDIVEIKYYTPGPELFENKINEYKKIITVSSKLHYENVLTYTDVPETTKESIKLYWIKETGRELFENVNYIDS
ncbi:hypothetical protein GF327_05375, partial [Candidatus Woesearchaeota archaeon]|nr:hypothetical protein [Candidatus Woesearchaeota archaeon]